MRSFSVLRNVTALVTLACFTAPAVHAQLTVGGPGDPNGGDGAPFGLVQLYQQLYASSLFPGSITISGLTFFNKNYTPGSIDNANYTIHLSTTSKPVNGLSSTFANNIGADNQLFFNGNLSGPVNPTTHQFTITGTPFVYDPSLGNLLLDVVKNQSGSSSLYLDADLGDFAGFTRVYSFNNSPTGNTNNNYGLVTRFELAPAAVPEPSSIALLTGMSLTGAAFLRRRKQASKAA